MRPTAALSSALVFAVLAAACGGSSGGSGQSGIPGEQGTKGTGEPFLVDPNQSGGAANLHLAEVLWGRLVDVHEIDAPFPNGKRVDPPIFRDFVINPNVLTDGTRFVLDRNPVTQKERLVIQDTHGPDSPNSPDDLFLTLLREASNILPLVAVKNDDGSSSPPFSAVPRNACMVLRFDDCLEDSNPLNLVNTVRAFTGYLPTTPFSARVVFDPNHGAKVAGNFHTTRVLVDMTTSQVEAADPQAPPLDVNAIGLPASRVTSSSANVSVRIPSNADLGSGQPVVLTNLSGSPLDPDDNGPVDLDSPTLDIVRAVRSGNADDPSNGFLRDNDRPRVIGGWPVLVTNPANDLAGELGFDFEIDLTFTTTCLSTPEVGDVITVGENFAQVTEVPNPPNVDLKVRTVFPLADPQGLMGEGLFQAPFQTSSPLASGCWVDFLPDALTPPVTGVKTNAQVLVRFSEPMDPESLSPFSGLRNGFTDGFMLVKGAAGGSGTSTAIASNIIVGEVLAANRDLTAFSFVPHSPYPHAAMGTETLHIELGEGASDLAGNRLRNRLPFVDFSIAQLEAQERNAAIVLRFESNDEYAPDGNDPDAFGDAPDMLLDLRGQFFYDRGMVIGRPVTFAGWPVDRNNPVPMRMLPRPGLGALLSPMNPLGARLQMLWRYCDTGWDVSDETKFNLDVIGLSWSPFNGVIADFYNQFEILLGHSRFLPDEGPPIRASSGLPSGPFDDNYLAGSNPAPGGRGGVVVHNRALGYVVNPADQFSSPSGTPLMPYPLNRGLGQDVTYTWRDTSILARGADGDPNQEGIPLRAEAAAGVVGPMQPGTLGGPRNVPSFGLPLLVEFRCHPSDQGLGFNTLSLGTAGVFPVPAFRAFSAGGVNTLGNPEIVLPDSEISPRGGFNPTGTPPGVRTMFGSDDNFYLGQLDTVVRISRVHTVWLDAGTSIFPLWKSPILEPSLASQPTGTKLLIDYRSASGFSAAGSQPFDKSKLNAYGDQIASGDPQPQSLSGWSNQISIGDGKRFLQLRLTFVSNIDTRVGPELDALALPYDFQ